MSRLKTAYVGALASLLCLIHCMATPFLFLVKTYSNTCCVDAPGWWQAIDYVFLAVSGLSIYYATKERTSNWVRVALWSAWIVLSLGIMNKTIDVVPLPRQFIYCFSLVIVVLHLYNQRYYQGKKRACCATSNK
ncbi:MAG: MerC domain-containing protein [Bacteroidota bacterium]